MNIFKKILNIYYEMILPKQNNILTIYYQAKPGYKNYYQFNEIGFIPFIYKNFSIFHTAENTDLFHVSNRLKERFGNLYTLNDVFIIVKRCIDKFLSNRNNYNIEQSFLITFKSYPFQVVFQVSPNLINFEDKEKLSKFYQQEYFGFIYTILTDNMQSINKQDKKIFSY